MRIIVAPDSFKGSLDAFRVCKAIEAGIKNVSDKIVVEKVPMADGGEGTVQALVHATGGSFHTTKVMGPLGTDVDAEWGMLGDGTTAVLEMAAASGLPLVPPDLRNPMETTSYGTGQLIRAAIDHGADTILLGIGGSATSEFGCGMAQALGVRFFDSDGTEIKEPINGRLIGAIQGIDLSAVPEAVKKCNIQVACDVDNPLLGPRGAVYTYSPQKGADEKMCRVLEDNMSRLAETVAGLLRDVRDLPGAGAAGGMGGGLVAFFDALLRPGVEIVLEAVNFSDKINGADLIITGEGKLDRQTIFGKTIAGVARTARSAGVPVVALAGQVDVDGRMLDGIGVVSAFSICSGPMDLGEAMSRTKELLAKTSEQLVRLLLLDR